MLRRALSGGRKPHIGVVGAGFAGLRCADVLLQHGAKVTILEARNRVGGRLCQGELNGRLVDLGPNWIHGTDDNPILDLAKETNTLTHTWDGRQSVFDHQGNAVPEEKAAEFTELVWKVIADAYEYVNEHDADIPPERSLWDFFKEKSKEMFPDSEPDAESKRDTLTSMAEMWGAFVGSSIQRQSLKFFWLEECIDGENLFVAETYRKVLERVAKPALAGADIKFGCKVIAISSIWEGKQAPKVYVDTAAGDSFTFDEVVMTTPLGWLKKKKKAFKPELPTRLSEAVDAIGYGCLDKTYITFPSAFWESSGEEEINLRRIPSNEQRNAPNVTATTAPLHQPETDSTLSSKHYPGFTHWTRPFYAKDTNPHCWNQECVNLAALPSSAAHSTILFYHYGAQSQWISSLLRTEPDWKRVLLDFFQPYFSRLPNYSPDSEACKPTDLLTTGWAGDEFAGYGSYCNFQVGLEKGDEDIQVMREGMPDRGVWLAGEHTAPFVALGTVTGAYWSGQAVAMRIAKAHGLEQLTPKKNEELGEQHKTPTIRDRLARRKRILELKKIVDEQHEDILKLVAKALDDVPLDADYMRRTWQKAQDDIKWSYEDVTKQFTAFMKAKVGDFNRLHAEVKAAVKDYARLDDRFAAFCTDIRALNREESERRALEKRREQLRDLKNGRRDSIAPDVEELEGMCGRVSEALARHEEDMEELNEMKLELVWLRKLNTAKAA